MKSRFLVVGFFLVSGAAAWALQEGQSVINTPHNLSVSGPGEIRASSEDQVCIFCHTPHHAAPVQPLWNRNLPVAAYAIYSSAALDANPGQPTGSSKLCLSCHDGTIALGSVVSREQIIQMASGITTLPPGTSNLGTDLSDDHPISFRYDSGLLVHDPNLVDPGWLPAPVKLDRNGELQCTTCHDAHDNSFSSFLVMSNSESALCRTCHTISDTVIPAHVSCNSCHRTHTSPSGPYLLQQDRIATTCLSCHDGSVANAANIASELFKISMHDTDSEVDPPDPIPAHATCADCHDPHTMSQGGSSAPTVPANFGRVAGVSAMGTPTPAASFEYEVCFRCHADQNAVTRSFVSRQIEQSNTRLEFASNAISFHPVEVPGRNSDVPSLKPEYTTASMIYCSDCHGSEADGGGPQGVHGSNNLPLLVRRYETTDYTPESASTYALCYDCHYRDGATGILSDLTFMHDLHVREERAPCSVCHDAHGISSLQGQPGRNSHLINFDTTVVQPNSSGTLEFIDLGTRAGNCTLRCHGETHDAEEYLEGEGT